MNSPIIEVAVTLSWGRNQTLDINEGAAITVQPAMPFKNCPMCISLWIMMVLKISDKK